MFRWYQKAEVCYAYLSDVNAQEDPNGPNSTFRGSVWFTRGWTLQELLAPRVLYFYGSDWQEIGARNFLSHTISQITNIDELYFISGNLSKYSVAQKMSWASRRQTSRIEDTAYCLLGIFGINMPLLYGEGEAAFRRLQEEIIRRSGDDSIFACELSTGSFSAGECLAASPEAFKASGNIEHRYGDSDVLLDLVNDPSMSITSSGIQITLRLLDMARLAKPVHISSQLGVLQCGTRADGKAVVIHLEDGRRYDGPYTLVNRDAIRETKVKTITLKHRQIRLQFFWVPKNYDAGAERVMFTFPSQESSDFELFHIDRGGLSIRDRSSSGLLFTQTWLGLFATSHFFFADRDLQGFGITMHPMPTTIHTTLYTDLKFSSLDKSQQPALPRLSDSPCHRGDKIRARQKCGKGEVDILLTTRRGPKTWFMHLSIFSSPVE